MADAFVEHDVELGLLEGRRNLVLHDLHARAVAGVLLPFLDRADAADVEADRRIELERATTRRGLGTAEHDADLLADLVDEDDRGARTVHRAGDLAQRLAHQPRLQTDVRIAHFAFDFGTGYQSSDRVDDH